MRCERCGEPGQPLTPDDPDDLWVLCQLHTDEVTARLRESADDSRSGRGVDRDEIMRVVEQRRQVEARKERMRAVLAAAPPGERGKDFAEGLRQDIEFLRPQRMRATAMLLGDDEQYMPMRWWNVIRQVRARWAALGHIWVHNGPLWRVCSDCRSMRREETR